MSRPNGLVNAFDRPPVGRLDPPPRAFVFPVFYVHVQLASAILWGPPPHPPNFFEGFLTADRSSPCHSQNSSPGATSRPRPSAWSSRFKAPDWSWRSLTAGVATVHINCGIAEGVLRTISPPTHSNLGVPAFLAQHASSVLATVIRPETATSGAVHSVYTARFRVGVRRSQQQSSSTKS